MESKYYIKDVVTWLYLDWYCADVYFTNIAEVSNCRYDTIEHAEAELLRNWEEFLWEKYLTIEKIIIN